MRIFKSIVTSNLESYFRNYLTCFKLKDNKGTKNVLESLTLSSLKVAWQRVELDYGIMTKSQNGRKVDFKANIT